MNDWIKDYKVTVIALREFHELHVVDQADNPTGEYFYSATDEEDALDQFHDEVPIKMLEDFEINVEEY